MNMSERLNDRLLEFAGILPSNPIISEDTNKRTLWGVYRCDSNGFVTSKIQDVVFAKDQESAKAQLDKSDWGLTVKPITVEQLTQDWKKAKEISDRMFQLIQKAKPSRKSKPDSVGTWDAGREQKPTNGW